MTPKFENLIKPEMRTLQNLTSKYRLFEVLYPICTSLLHKPRKTTKVTFCIGK